MVVFYPFGGLRKTSVPSFAKFLLAEAFLGWLEAMGSRRQCLNGSKLEKINTGDHFFYEHLMNKPNHNEGMMG